MALHHTFALLSQALHYRCADPPKHDLITSTILSGESGLYWLIPTCVNFWPITDAPAVSWTLGLISRLRHTLTHALKKIVCYEFNDSYSIKMLNKNKIGYATARFFFERGRWGATYQSFSGTHLTRVCVWEWPLWWDRKTPALCSSPGRSSWCSVEFLY